MSLQRGSGSASHDILAAGFHVLSLRAQPLRVRFGSLALRRRIRRELVASRPYGIQRAHATPCSYYSPFLPRLRRAHVVSIMPNPLPIPFNPAILAWARQESGLAPDRIAKSVGVTLERLAEWEGGVRQPTMRQVEKLAHAFRRPFSIFFAETPPAIPPLAAAYRRLPHVQPGEESPELRWAIRQMIARRENAISLMEELGHAVPEFALRATLDEQPAAVGDRLRSSLGIAVEGQFAWKNHSSAWHAWREAVENLGLLVFQFSGVTLEEARGLSLLEVPMPVAAVNSKEIPETRAYTLMHEVVHLMLAATRQEAPANRERRSSEEWERVERFAEAAASYALVPEAALKDVIHRLGYDRVTLDREKVRKIARTFRVTPLAIATRLRESGYLTWPSYNRWRREWEAYVQTLPTRPPGFATPIDKAIGRGGIPFAQLVLEALSANRITSVDASRYLDLKFGHFEKLGSTLRSDILGLHGL